jgi:hypothetical protein
MIVIVPCGGLGNLLFQHAAAWSYAKEQGQELAALGLYPDAHIYRKKFGEYDNLFQHVKILNSVDETDGGVWQEPSFRYYPIPSGARILRGYFQSWKYFDNYRVELRDLLRTNESEIWEEQKNRFSGGVCMHVRRGDYLSYQDSHPVCTIEYYREAMKLFPNNKFLLFCEESVPELSGTNIEVVNEPDPVKTLFLMSLCEHFIIANSTLSLMAYYMRENEHARLVAPRLWFGAKGPSCDINDLVKNATLL